MLEAFDELDSSSKKEISRKENYILKIDYKSAYRQCHFNADMSIQACTQLPDEDLAIVALCLTLRGAPGPYEWGVLSESICDLSIAIMKDDGWDPTSLCAPNVQLVPPPLFLGNSIPFAEGKDLIIDVPVDARGTSDVYIDDTIAQPVDVEDSNNVQRLDQATLLAIHCSAREIKTMSQYQEKKWQHGQNF